MSKNWNLDKACQQEMSRICDEYEIILPPDFEDEIIASMIAIALRHAEEKS